MHLRISVRPKQERRMNEVPCFNGISCSNLSLVVRRQWMLSPVRASMQLSDAVAQGQDWESPAGM